MRLYFKYITFNAIFSVVFFSVAQSSLLAQETNEEDNICSDDKFTQEDIKCFDLDDNDFISEVEYEAFIKHRDNEVYRKLDTDKNGEISSDELGKYQRNVGKDIQFKLAIEEFKNFATLEGEPKDELSKKEAARIAIGPTVGSPQINLLGFQLREQYEDIRAFGSAKKDFKRFKGASLLFTSDFENNNDIFQAKGAIFRPIKISSKKVPSGSNMVFTGAAINPGVSFDRKDNSSSDDQDVNVLEFRLGSELEFSGGGFVDSLYLRTSLLYETDFDFNTGILGGELQLEPVKLGTGIGAGRKLGFFSYRLRPILHLEGGENYFRIGPKLSLKIWPEGTLERFTLATDYEFYQTLLSNSETRDLFNVSLTFRLDEGGNTTFRVGYRSGEVSLDRQDVNEFSLGFGLKF